MVVHELKCWPQFFEAVESGEKSFEIRRNDRDFRVGDVLLLNEWDKYAGYTGRALSRRVAYVTDWEQAPGVVVMGLQPLTNAPISKDGAGSVSGDDPNVGGVEDKVQD